MKIQLREDHIFDGPIKEFDEKGRKRTPVYLGDENFDIALQELKGSAFKIYMHFMTFDSGAQLPLSNEDLREEINLTEDEVEEGLKELQEKGYITIFETNENNYYFHAYPVKTK